MSPSTRASRSLGSAAFLVLSLSIGASRASAQLRRGSTDDPLLREAAVLEARGDLAGAERALRRLLEADPTSSGALVALERVARGQGHMAEVLPAIDTFLAREPAATGVRDLKLRVLVELDSIEGVRQAGDAWLRAQPGEADAYLSVARVYETALGRSEALAVLRAGRQRVGRNDAIALQIGDLLVVGGQREEGLREWVAAVGDDGSQAAAVTRRIRELPDGSADGGRTVVQLLSQSPVAARGRAAARMALDLGFEAEALELTRRIAAEMDGRGRESFLADVARRAREQGSTVVASWAYEALGEGASSPGERRSYDERIVDVSLAAGDTAQAVDAQRRVADSYSPGSNERRRALAQLVRLEQSWGGQDGLGSVVAGFRKEFPDAPELDELTAETAAALAGRGDTGGAMDLLEGVRGPSSSLERGYLLLEGGDLEGGRQELLRAAPGLDPVEATDVIQLTGLLGRLSAAGSALLVRIELAGRRARGAEVKGLVLGGVGALAAPDRAPVLAEAARVAERSGDPDGAAALRQRMLDQEADAPETAEAALALARYHAAREGGADRAIRILEDLISSRPDAAVVPDARIELERLRRRGP